MRFGRLTIRHVVCAGPGKTDAAVHLAPGANAIIGISERGKSYALELIDFMLGAEKLARELHEAAGYDTVLMGLESADGQLVTLRRAMSGIDMHVLDGLVESRTGGTVLEILAENQTKKGPRTINQFYLEKLGLWGMVLRSNKTTTQKLSIRTLSKLALVSEIRIIEQQSPIFSGQILFPTPEKSLFKLLVSGVDDSALVSYASEAKVAGDKKLRIAAGRQFVAERLTALKDQGLDERALRVQLAALETRCEDFRSDTGSAENELISFRRRIRRLTETKELIDRRKGELHSLLERFSLLNAHYASDMQRLKAIAEAAEALDSLAPGPCPLCGASSESQNHNQVCEADLPALAQAARVEVFADRKTSRGSVTNRAPR